MNITAVGHQVSLEERLRRNGHRGAVVWLTGLSAAGKSTLAMALEAQLVKQGYACYTLDGDNIRHGLNSNLGFSPEDRTENIRRVGEVAALFADAGLICVTAFISPYMEDRAAARRAAHRASFHEVYVSASLETCEARDPKGLYLKAREGQVQGFTGIDAPYEPPLSPELIIRTDVCNLAESIEALVVYVRQVVPLDRQLT